METKQRHPVNLKQYRKVEGKWQFVPVARDPKGNPDPRLVMLDSEPVASLSAPHAAIPSIDLNSEVAALH